MRFWFEIHVDSDVYHVQENYLDFLHPAAYHTSTFQTCEYLGREGEINLVELGYKMPFGKSLMTRTRVWAPSAWQIRNEVFDGLAVGMVIESHLTPITAEQTLIHEIYHVPEGVVPEQGWPFMRFFLRRSAKRIRVEDAVFSARRYRLRKLGFVDGRGMPIQGRTAPWIDEWPETQEAEIAALRLESLVGKRAPAHFE